MNQPANAGLDHAELQKRAAADGAVDQVRPGMVVGLGAGSTARFAITRLAERISEGRLSDITAVPCSREVGEVAARLGIRIGTLDDHPELDLTIDGADEVDPEFNLIKGAGGAFLREKMVEQASRQVIIVIDASKASPVLGSRRPVPVQVVEFGWQAQVRYLESMGARVRPRPGVGKAPFRTDDGQLVLDCAFGPIPHPREVAALLDARAGIVAHGLFLGMATDVLVGTDDGVRHLSRSGDPVPR